MINKYEDNYAKAENTQIDWYTRPGREYVRDKSGNGRYIIERTKVIGPSGGNMQDTHTQVLVTTTEEVLQDIPNWQFLMLFDSTHPFGGHYLGRSKNLPDGVIKNIQRFGQKTRPSRRRSRRHSRRKKK